MIASGSIDRVSLGLTAVDQVPQWADTFGVADLREQAAMSQLQERLTGRYVNVPPEQIVSAVRQAHAEFDRSKIRDFVPLLVERRVREQLSRS